LPDLFASTVSSAFDEVDSRHGGESLQVLKRQHQSSLDETMDQQFVFRGIDLRHSRVVRFEM
jgi:hypothetical protein